MSPLFGIYDLRLDETHQDVTECGRLSVIVGVALTLTYANLDWEERRHCAQTNFRSSCSGATV
ncbi:hypothetical protein R69776_03014 [Paraburkholderia nemoris]|uniref:Uncharacterized protein n=1 Tax=Paraburkholderia nemoris TaxID=2793076 RepID=A0ABN7LKD4_9BURK|nr:hypothetical protein R69776_03014 [Paraburkholderia nemoris]CAE6830194.1 hypothetical protein R75777_06564 [Paraburkholderia nemoris]